MPDKKGKLTDEETQAVHEWLAKKNVSRSCPACEQSTMVVASHMVSLIANKPDILTDGRHYPALVLFCANCGNFQFHSAILAEILEPDDSKSKEEAENAE